MRNILLFILGIISIVILSGCSKEATFDFEKGQLVVGLEAGYAPFNWMETNKTETNVKLDGMNAYVEGYDVQIAKIIADDLGLELVIKMIDWDGLIPALKSGMIDVIIAGMSPTEKRLKSISFTEEYYRSEHVVIVKNNSPYANASKFSDFKDAKIMGQKSTIYDVLANQLASIANGKYQEPLDNVPAIVYSVKTGVTDVTIVEKPVAISIVSSNPDLIYISLTNKFEVSAEDELVSIGVRKSDNELRQKINESLAKISNEVREQLMEAAITKAPASDEQ